MRNLLLLHAHRQYADHLTALISPRICANQSNAHIAYVASANRIYRLDTDARTSTLIKHWEARDSIVDVQHLSLNDELCVATAAGDVRVVNLRTNQEDMVSFCASGIRRMAWSPDQEAIAIVTGNGVLIVMDTLYTRVAECVFNEAGFGQSAFVYVGWGDIETQFHGSEGKEARYSKAECASSIADNDIEQKRYISVKWRGDSEYFAVSFVGATGREFKVFDKEGTLQFTSEPSVGLSGCLSWRPSGTWIAVPQRLANKYVVALFEKNGLKHREIVLPFYMEDECVQRLEWSSDSDVLAIGTLIVASGHSRIYLYTMCNYHWYQKQTLYFEGTTVVHFVWDSLSTDGRRLHVLTAGGEYIVYRWISEVNASRTHGADDEAVVAAVDGRRVLLTGCRGAVVPPPMFSLELAFERHVNWIDWVGFVGDKDRCDGVVNRFAVVDAANVVHVYSCHAIDGILKEVRALGEFRIDKPSGYPLGYTHWLYLTGNTIIYASAATIATGNHTLYLGELVDGVVQVKATKTLSGQLHRLTGVSAHEFAAATSSGLFRITLDAFNDANDAFVSPTFSYPDAVEHLCVADVDSRDTFALKPKHWLYHNGRVIATGVTSMHLSDQYLMFTTLDVLRFVRLADGEIVGDRRVERGARLVIAVPQDCRTVLQMPRGNLETIQPRVLSLCIIGRLLDAGDYHQAFDAMRKQRINLNLLIDHDRQAFLNRVEKFVQSMRNAQWLNLFLSDLDVADVTVTMYVSNYPRIREIADFDKVHEVCSRVRSAIDTLQLSGPLLLPILTTFVKQNQLEQALQIVWNIKQQEDLANVAPTAVDVCAAEALKYLLYLVDVNALYNVALGMYDFDLVRFIAAKSQKDPKEYLPQLAALQQINDQAYRQYRIDVLLKRFERAVAHIVSCGAGRSDECVELIVKHSLYTYALRLFESRQSAGEVDDTECYRRVVRAFAENLREGGKFRDACLMYERCGDYAQAILSAKHILDWQKCLALARRLGQSDKEMAQLASSMVPALVENNSRLEAANLVLKYQDNIALAVQILCDGRHYVQALFEARMSNEALIESLIRPQVQAYAESFVSVLEADRMQFLEYKQRLATIRVERAVATQSGEMDSDHFGLEADPDAFSDTSSMRSSRCSMSSRGTGKTHRSSKNRRKHERKLLSLKPGNKFEDIALVDALHGLSHKAFDHQQSVRALGKALIDLQLDAHGRSVQSALRKLLHTVTDSLDEVWISEMMVSNEYVPLAEDGRLDYALVQQDQHYSMIKPHQRYKPQLRVIDWEFVVLD